MPFFEFEIALMALCAWREARGEGHDGMRAVLHVVRNRVLQGGGASYADVVFARHAFSSMTYGADPELSTVPKPDDPAFRDAAALARLIHDSIDPDNTNGATHYFNPGIVMPSWAKSMKLVATIGHHTFYR